MLWLLILGGAIGGVALATRRADKRAARKLGRAAATNREPKRIRLEETAKALQARYARRHPER